MNPGMMTPVTPESMIIGSVLWLVFIVFVAIVLRHEYKKEKDNGKK